MIFAIFTANWHSFLFELTLCLRSYILPSDTNDLVYDSFLQRSKLIMLPGGRKMKYGVRIILDQIEVEADSQEEAEQIAQDIYDGDAHTRLHAGLSVVDYEVEELE